MRTSLAVVGFVLILVQGVVLASVAVPAPHTGGDNAAYLSLAGALADGAGYVEPWDPETPPHTKYPPGYPVVLALMALAGAATWTAFKLSSAVALSGATLLAFGWAAHRKGALAAGALALLLVLAAGWQDASRWILSEPWFLLWTYLTFWAGERALDPVEGGTPVRRGQRTPDRMEERTPDRPTERASDRRGLRAAAGPGRTGWLVLAAAGALMAFGVRSAGLPVVLALGGALLLARRWRAGAVFGAVAAAVVGGWVVRAALQGGGEGAYQSEFWMRNPYDPELGTVGAGGLAERVWTNLGLYVSDVLPAEWWAGEPGAAGAVFGAALALLALAGWARALGAGVGPAELFLPLYAGMILLWPEVWSGDRFLLPLLPLLILYAGEALAASAARLERRLRTGRDAGTRARPRAVGPVLATGLLVLAVPSVPGTIERAGAAAECRARVDAADDAFACYGAGIREFRAAAAWMGENLPSDAAALSRKPRILHALGGPPGRTFPFSPDPEPLLAEARAAGARYLLLDHWDPLAYQNPAVAVSARPEAFCFVAAWEGAPGGPVTQLLGILPPEQRAATPPEGGLERCPAGWTSEPPREPVLEGRRVPVFTGGGT